MLMLLFEKIETERVTNGRATGERTKKEQATRQVIAGEPHERSWEGDERTANWQGMLK